MYLYFITVRRCILPTAKGIYATTRCETVTFYPFPEMQKAPTAVSALITMPSDNWNLIIYKATNPIDKQALLMYNFAVPHGTVEDARTRIPNSF